MKFIYLYIIDLYIQELQRYLSIRKSIDYFEGDLRRSP